MKKPALNFIIMIALWTLVLMAGIWLSLLICLAIMGYGLDGDIYLVRPSYIYTYVAFCFIYFLWRIVTYRKNDLCKLSKKLGGENCQSERVSFLYKRIRARFDDILMMARLDRSWLYLLFSSPTVNDVLTVSKKKAWKEYNEKYAIKPDKFYTASKVGFLVPVQTPHRVDIEIDKRKNHNLPATGINEIDNILSQHLLGESDFHGRLKIDDKVLKLTVIGGSWLGGKFGDRIQKGYEIIRDLYEALKGQFPQSNDSEVDVIWNQRTGEFELIKKEQ